MFKMLLVSLALASGCAFQYPEPPTPAEQEKAFSAVWDGLYDASQYPRPIVNFDKPNCHDEYGNDGISLPSSPTTCLLGYNGQKDIHILWSGWETSAFAHELFHAYIIDTTPSWLQSEVAGDPNHDDPRWISLVKDKASEWGAPALVTD